jgi:hypothetical protein
MVAASIESRHKGGSAGETVSTTATSGGRTTGDQTVYATFGRMIDIQGIGSENVGVREMMLYPSR